MPNPFDKQQEECLFEYKITSKYNNLIDKSNIDVLND